MFRKMYSKLLSVKQFCLVGFVCLSMGMLPSFSVSAEELENPIRSTSIVELLEAFLAIIIVILIPVIIVMLIISGLLYVTAQGNAERLKLATRAFVFALIGGVIVLAGFAITAMIQAMVGEFG